MGSGLDAQTGQGAGELEQSEEVGAVGVVSVRDAEPGLSETERTQVCGRFVRIEAV